MTVTVILLIHNNEQKQKNTQNSTCKFNTVFDFIHTKGSFCSLSLPLLLLLKIPGSSECQFTIISIIQLSSFMSNTFTKPE